MGWLVIGVGYAAMAALFTPLTWPAMLATLPPAAAAVWLAVRPPDRPTAPVPGLRRVMPWAVVIGVGSVWELVALFGSPRTDFPTISSIVSPLAGTQWWFRFVGYLVWFAIGMWLVRR